MMWLKRNFIALIGTIMFLALLGGALYLLLQTKQRQSQVQQEYLDLERQYNDLIKKSFTPSQHNVEILEEQTQVLSEYLRDILGRLPKQRVEYKTMQRWAFKGYLETRVSRLDQYCKTNQVQIPSGFTWGFGEYWGDRPPPKQENTPKLLHQLDLTERLVHLLVDSKVLEISSLSRTYLEGETTAATKDRVDGGVWKQDHNLIYESQIFEVGFRCDFDQLRAVLNNIAQSTNPIVLVRNIAVWTERANPPEPKEATAPTATSDVGAEMGAVPMEFQPPGRGRGRMAEPLGRRQPTQRQTDLPRGIQLAMGDEISDVSLRLEIVELNRPRQNRRPPGAAPAAKIIPPKVRP